MRLFQQVLYCEFEDNVMELDGYGSESSVFLSLGEVVVFVFFVDRYFVSYVGKCYQTERFIFGNRDIDYMYCLIWLQ